MILYCLICQKQFKKSPCRLRTGRGKYCSKNCFHYSQKDKRVSIRSEFKKGHPYGKRIKKGEHLSPTTEFKKIKGKPHCAECKKELHNYEAKYCKGCVKLGSRSPFWKGGISEKNRTERQNFMRTIEYKKWRFEVFKRDNFSCIICGYEGKELEADHIKPYILYPELRLDINNGRTLCKKCHISIGWHGNQYSYI